jgi:threonine dehydratase
LPLACSGKAFDDVYLTSGCIEEMHPDPKLVKQAGEALRKFVVRTPLLEAPLLNNLVAKTLGLSNIRCLVKAECLQHTGAFKYRGAANRILNMTDAEREKGVVAFSSGNFAQALALAATNNNTKCCIHRTLPHNSFTFIDAHT